jgi:hypothetical protein
MDDAGTAESNSADNPKLIVGGATLLLRHWGVLSKCWGEFGVLCFRICNDEP